MMNRKETNTLIIVLAVVFGFAFIFSFGGMMGGIGGMHGSNLMCSEFGGIWCYWPSFGFMWIFMLLIPALILIALVLFIIWLARELNKSGGKRRR
jgi:hypothetical protein